ncbi:MAG TPA: MltA domain-containing protein, partial [Rhizobacter sp.]|nr:MltA domain-containing protein [Rhizobacter sp.]
AALLGLAACASPAPGPGAAAVSTQASGTPAAKAPSATPQIRAGTPAGGAAELRTRNAMFKLATFDELPGWPQDDLRAGWGAFRNSCEVLQKREEWRDICIASRGVTATQPAIRAFFESRFTLLRILNADASREGEVTGYFEPLLEGRLQRSTEFNVPVMGVPRDLVTIDWAKVPKAQRRSVLRVKAEGGMLVLAAPGEAATYALDLRRFDLDDRDRRLRLRLVNDASAAHAEPYYSRAELDARGLPEGIDAPVIAWVKDPLALYAMQVQGSGRVRLPGGDILRLQYAEQNGHPFKPLRLLPHTLERVVTRGTGPAAEEPESFSIEGDDAAAPAAQAAAQSHEEEHNEPVVTRGGGVPPAPAATAAAAPKRTAAGVASADSDRMVDQLLQGSRRNPAAPSPAAKKPGAAAPAIASSNAAVQRIDNRLVSDPSYVFFKTVEARPDTEGPQGALGVPLTAGRSVAVDPRITPLGYPMFLSAPAPAGSTITMQRLVFAQDTGGAIRGALRADYFWGFGNAAGQKARQTRHRGQMWVLLPAAEAKRLAASRIVTRGVAGGAPADAAGTCLVDDGEFCSEPD